MESVSEGKKWVEAIISAASNMQVGCFMVLPELRRCDVEEANRFLYVCLKTVYARMIVAEEKFFDIICLSNKTTWIITRLEFSVSKRRNTRRALDKKFTKEYYIGNDIYENLKVGSWKKISESGVVAQSVKIRLNNLNKLNGTFYKYKTRTIEGGFIVERIESNI